MRTTLLCLALVGVLVAGPASLDLEEPSAHADTPPPLVLARPADSLVDSFGVAVHMAYRDTPYRDATAVARALSDLGVRHVRDDLFMNNPQQYAAMRTVAAAGARFDLIMGKPTGTAGPAQYVATVADQLTPGVVESVEGANEWDISGRPAWTTELRDHQRRLYEAAKANPRTAGLPVLAPALAFRNNYQALGPMTGVSDYANGHQYTGGYPPSASLDTSASTLRAMTGNPSVVYTESGYTNAVNTSSGHLPVPESVSASYAPRLLLEHAMRGISRVYDYELIDEFDDPGLTNIEAHFGLLRHDLTPKPEYTTMRNLLDLVEDPGPAFEPDHLGLDIQGGADTRSLLVQRRDGAFVLFLWRDVSLYDPKTKVALSVAPRAVGVTLANAAEVDVYRPVSGPRAVDHQAGTQLSVPLAGDVTALVISRPGAGEPTAPPVVAPALPTAPAWVGATPRNGSLAVRWVAAAAASSEAVTGYRVRLTPGGKEVVVRSDARSLLLSGLRNGTSYAVSVQALSGTRSSTATSVGGLVPVGPPAPPRSPRVSVKKNRIGVTWDAPVDDGGSPVLGYRISSGGKQWSVGASPRQLWLPRQQRGKRVTWRLEARNALGWSPVRALSARG